MVNSIKSGSVRILHLTPHLGGGVGRVLLSYLTKTKENPVFIHSIACLDSANENAAATAGRVGFPLFEHMSKNRGRLLDLIARSDVVLVHWWNHPLLYDFMVREEVPESRVILWSHIAGFHPPYVFTRNVLQYPDVFVFTTPASFETEEVQNLPDVERKRLRLVWSTSGVEYVRAVRPKKHSGYNVGYIGTVDYAKMHPDYLNICNNIEIPDVKFIVCGGPSEKEIRKEAEELGITGKFDFTGLVSDITEYLSLFDVFGYPLAPYHYGTCDQVLAESMAAGVVPVVLRNRMETYMVKDGVTGIVANTADDYVRAIQTLYNNEGLRNSLSGNAREYAVSTFSVNKMAGQWEEIIKEALTIPKSRKKWNISKNNNEITATDVFLESLGIYGEPFASYRCAKSEDERIRAAKRIVGLNASAIWRANTRGTVHHYDCFLPDDHYLSIWSELMKNGLCRD